MSDEQGLMPRCDLDLFLRFLGREWTSHIVWVLGAHHVMRFSELRRALPGKISARVLSGRLKELESYGLISRHDTGKLPLHVEYKLTASGKRLNAALRRAERFARAVKPGGKTG